VVSDREIATDNGKQQQQQKLNLLGAKKEEPRRDFVSSLLILSISEGKEEIVLE